MGPSATFARVAAAGVVALSTFGCLIPASETGQIADETPPATARKRATPTVEKTEAGHRVQLREQAMGTRVLLAAYTTDTLDDQAVSEILHAAHDEIKRLEGLMTTWDSRSEISRVNAAAGREAVVVSPETFTVVEKALWIAEHSEGTFDITFASMGSLWRFDEDRIKFVPDAAELEEGRRKIDYRVLAIDPEKRTVKINVEGRKISLGGIAKGYAIDRAAAVMRDAGLSSFYAQAGGDLYVGGHKPNGKPVRVGVRDPRGEGHHHFAAVEVEDHAFSTAGDYERSFIKNGKRYHHIIDPRTGYPATASRSVTIWAKTALMADALDDAVFILGPEKGLALVESIEGCGAVIVDKDNKVWVSKRLQNKVSIRRPPTDAI
ncbi:MAG: FAD:protein FMN transferase [Myxococcota bacterium]